MKKIIFVRTAPYQYRLSGKSLYSSFDAIGLQKANPHILEPSRRVVSEAKKIIKKHKPELVLCSQFIRSQETARLLSDNILVLPELNEIKFSMEDFSNPSDLSSDKLDPDKMNSLRYDFSQALINDQLQESREEILTRIVNFKNILSDVNLPETILCCSHGFMMKLFENYFLSEKSGKDLQTLVEMYDWEKTTFQFLKGFEYRTSNKKSFNLDSFVL